MSDPKAPAPLDLAALLCSRLCHDLIGPVGAILNGIELLEDEDSDEELRGLTIDLVKRSATQVAARIQFARIALGKGGGRASVPIAEIERVTRGFFEHERADLHWAIAEPATLSLDAAKLLMNGLLLTAQALPSGGVLSIALDGNGGSADAVITASGHPIRVLPAFAVASGEAEGSLDATDKSAQGLLVRLLCEASGAALAIEQEEGRLSLRLGGAIFAGASV